ncbi:Uncharacterised protein [Clostridium putrefaciens]|uniref:Uncharacterized protein n=1 Tax=Clostridium putrefaciens TaxID=99675 RepID=A0A381JBC3_9CLOT|nr:Uncharacterised protein [Clostridium putrefaciens]
MIFEVNTDFIQVKVFKLFFRIVDTYPRILVNAFAPSLLLNVPEIFCLTLVIRKSRSARLLSKGISKSYIKASI